MRMKIKDRMTMGWKGKKEEGQVSGQAIWRGVEEDCELREGISFLINKDSKRS